MTIEALAMQALAIIACTLLVSAAIEHFLKKKDSGMSSETKQDSAKTESTGNNQTRQPCECEIVHTTCSFCRAKWDRDSYVEWRP